MQKNNKIMMIVGIVFIIVVAVAVSFSLFYYSRKSGDINLNSGDININYAEETNYFTLHSDYPKSDALGMIDPNFYDFTVTGNTSKNNIIYEIQIIDNDDNTISPEYIKVYLTDQEDNEITAPTNLNDLTYSNNNSKRVIYSNTIIGNNIVHNYRLRLWISEEFTENIEKTYGFQINLYARNDESSQ